MSALSERHCVHVLAGEHLNITVAVARLLAAPHNSDAPPFALVEFQRTCAPPEELLLVDTCFDKGAGEAIGCEKVMSRETRRRRLWRTRMPGCETDPLSCVASLIGVPRSLSNSILRGLSHGVVACVWRRPKSNRFTACEPKK